MKSITILSLSLFQISISDCFSLLVVPSLSPPPPLCSQSVLLTSSLPPLPSSSASIRPFNLSSSARSAHPGWRDHRSHHRGGSGPAGAHRGHLLPDAVPGGSPRLQPQRQVSAWPVAGGALPAVSLPGPGAEAGAHPWHRHLRDQAGVAAAP